MDMRFSSMSRLTMGQVRSSHHLAPTLPAKGGRGMIRPRTAHLDNHVYAVAALRTLGFLSHGSASYSACDAGGKPAGQQAHGALIARVNHSTC